MHYIYGRCDLCLSLYKKLRASVYCMLEDGYGFVPHFSLVVCQSLRFIVQHSLAVWVETEPF